MHFLIENFWIVSHRQVTDAPIVKFQADTEVYCFDWYLIPMFFAFEFYLVFLFFNK